MEGLDVKALFKPKKKITKASAAVETAPTTAALEETPALPAVLTIETPKELKTSDTKVEEIKDNKPTWGVCVDKVEETKSVVVAAAPAASAAPTRYVPPSLRRGEDSATTRPASSMVVAMPTLAEYVKEMERTKTITSTPTPTTKPKDAEELARKEKEKEERKRQLHEELNRAASSQQQEKPKEVAASFEVISAKYANRPKLGRQHMLVF